MSCIVKKNWLLGGYSAQFALAIPLEEISLSHTTSRLLRTTKSALDNQSSPLEFKNVKGRDRSCVLIPELPAPLGEELVTVGGTIATGQETSGEFSWAPFHLSLVTRFSKFEGNRTIIHSVEEMRSDSLPQWLPWWLLGAAAPIRVQYARFGFDRFTSAFSMYRFGFTPVVSDSLRLDLTTAQLSILLTTDRARMRSCNPFREVELFTNIAAAVRLTLKEPLEEVFDQELREAAPFLR